MANYINIGSTCAPFSESGASYEIATNSKLFYITNGTSPTSPVLRHTPAVGYSTSQSSNLVVYSDFQYKIWWNSNVVTSGTSRSLWRVISPGTSTNDGILTGGGVADSYTTGGIHGLKVVSASSWTSLTGAVADSASLSYVSFSADSVVSPPPARETNLTIVTTTPSSASYITTAVAAGANVFTNMIGSPLGLSYTSGVTNNYFYLKEGTTTNYLRYAASTLSRQDVNGLVNLTDTEYRFRLYINTGTPGRIFVALYSGDTGTIDLSTLALVSFSGSSWRVVHNSISYSFIASNIPPVGVTASGTQTIPADVTLLKLAGSTSSYLRWDGFPGNVSQGSGSGKFTVEDYWVSGMSTSNIVQQVQFYFGDMTSANASPGVPGNVDIYKWYVLTSPSNLSPSPTSVSNVVAAPTGNVFVTNATTLSGADSLNYNYVGNSANEGWVLLAQNSSATNASTRVALVYANVVTGTAGFTPMCYANVVPSTSPAQIKFARLPASTTWGTLAGIQHAFSWNCVKCTPNAGATCAASGGGGLVITVLGGGLSGSLSQSGGFNYYTITTSLSPGSTSLTDTGTVTFTGGPTTVRILLVGGGGGGSAGSGGGGYVGVLNDTQVNPGSFNVGVGRGGEAEGAAGGRTIFNLPTNNMIAGGGSGGQGNGAGGTGGTLVGGTFNGGGSGGQGTGAGGTGGTPGVTVSGWPQTTYGAGGVGVVSATGGNGTGGGGGGSGTASTAGGAGGSGVIIIRWS
jgi:hypothetical protein